MDAINRISEVFKKSKEVFIDDSSRLALISDCHRGDGTSSDSFYKNERLYFTAINHYYQEGYTYVEVGDGDELWENRNFYDIQKVHSNVFKFLSKFYNEKRLYFIYGNHDMIKKDEEFVNRNFYRYFDQRTKSEIPLFEDIKIHEGLVLKYKREEDKILVIHGHQADFLNDDLWVASKYMVRYLWRPLEMFGVKDPTSTAKNYEKKLVVEKKLVEWVEKEKHILITGHTHRPMFPKVGQPPYFNDGSCVHPRCITAIEIVDGYITLVKWNIKIREDGVLFVGKDILAGPCKLEDYFNSFN